MVSRKKFIESFNADCANWTWSWSFINHEDQFVIFGFWDDLDHNGKATILNMEWEFLNGRRQNGYPQAIEHIRHVEEDGYKLKVFRMYRPDDTHLNDEASKLAKFETRLISAGLHKEGSTWIAVINPADPGQKKPKTQNPDWTFDELVLALDCYIKHQGRPPSQSSKEIEVLSRTINLLNKIRGIGGGETFRNPNGVHMKMMNFRRFDNSIEGKGLKGGGNLDEVVWNKFSSHPDKLHVLAEQIRAFVSSGEGNSLPEMETEDIEGYEAQEGALIIRVHKSRERDKKLVREKKASVKNSSGNLCCEACGFDFQSTYGDRGLDYIECHHTKPISELKPGESTRLKDLSLVCSNCHRMIHRQQPMLTIEALRQLLLYNQ